MEVVCAVVAERKTSGAAQRLGISQPAVSRAITKIEQKLGRPLFQREAKRLVPTADALAIYQRSAAIFEALDEFEALSRTREHGQLHIVAPPTMSRFFLQREAAAFAKVHPEILISFDIVSLQELASFVAEQRGDLGILDTNVLHPGVEFESLIETSAACFLPAQHPLARKKEIKAEDLDGVEYVSITRRHALRGTLDRVFSDAGVKPRSVIETHAAVSALDFVGEGLGVSVLNPFPLVLDLAKRVIARPFVPHIAFKTSFVLPRNTPHAPSVRRFIDFVKGRQRKSRSVLAPYFR